MLDLFSHRQLELINRTRQQELLNLPKDQLAVDRKQILLKMGSQGTILMGKTIISLMLVLLSLLLFYNHHSFGCEWKIFVFWEINYILVSFPSKLFFLSLIEFIPYSEVESWLITRSLALFFTHFLMPLSTDVVTVMSSYGSWKQWGKKLPDLFSTI